MINRTGETMTKCTLIHGDCIEEMQKLIDKETKVDLILTDPPYGTTSCKWDSVIPFDKMWDRLHQICYETSPILLFGTQPFLSELIHSNLRNFKYNLIWDKHSISNPFL
jgi:site-specific DNA-methyltransferase (adenine-specific)